MRDRVVDVRDACRGRLWPIPTAAVVIAVLVGAGLPELEARGHGAPALVDGWLFGGDAPAARSVLSTIAASLTTVTALTFSLTVVTLQLASSQFSPRLLRTFSSDLFVQSTLALFLATFIYSVTVLRAVRGSGDNGANDFVPAAAVTLAFVLAVSSVLGLVLFLAHLSAQVRVENMLRTVRLEAERTIRVALPERDANRWTFASLPSPPGAAQISAGATGFVIRIESDSLLELAGREDVLVSIEVYPGAFVVAGSPLGRIWSAGPEVLATDRADDLAARVASCVQIGVERTTAQDVSYGLRQLTDVAVRALSPGINDPTTAVHALGHISALLCNLTARDTGPQVLTEHEGRTSVLLQRPDFATLVEIGISQPRRYGSRDPQVLGKILEVLLDLSRRVAPDQTPAVLEQLQRTRATVAEQKFDAVERATLDELGTRVEEGLRAVTSRRPSDGS